MRWRLGILALLLVLSTVTRAETKGKLSFEEVYDPLHLTMRNSLKARMDHWFTPIFSFYLVAGSEAPSKAATPWRFSPGTFMYGGPGVRAHWDGFYLSTDIRFRQEIVGADYVGAPRMPLVDAQTLLTYENYWDTPLRASFPLNGFIEVWSETLFSTADYGNIAHNTLARVGAESKVLPGGGHIGFFVEPNLLLDTVKHYYNNRLEFRLSGRIRYNVKPVEFNLTVSYLVNKYFDVQRLEDYAPPNRNRGFAAKLVFSVDV